MSSVQTSDFWVLFHMPPMCISHTRAVQHTALSASDLGSPTTSFQCLKSQKGSEALELCFVQQTLLPCSRSCAGSRISRSGLMQCSPSLAGSPDSTQGQTCQMAHSADMPVLFMMFRGTGKGTYTVIYIKRNGSTPNSEGVINSEGII